MPNESVVTEGVNEDFVWYEAEVLLSKLKEVEARLQKLSSVTRQRYLENREVMSKLLIDNTHLRAEISTLRANKEQVNG